MHGIELQVSGQGITCRQCNHQPAYSERCGSTLVGHVTQSVRHPLRQDSTHSILLLQ